MTMPYDQKYRRVIIRVYCALRIILLEDGETVHNAFFDRDFKE